MDELSIQPGSRQRRPSRLWRFLRYSLILLLALVAGAVAYLQSDGFKEALRQRIVTELRQRLGTEVTLNEFEFSWLSLTARLGGLTIAGKPAPGEQSPSLQPFFLARSVEASWHLLSLVPLRADFDSLQVLEPRIRVRFHPDGSSNIPAIRASGVAGGLWAEQLIRLRMGRVELLEGEIEWEERRMPLAFQADEFALSMKFNPIAPSGTETDAQEGYTGTLSFEGAQLKLREATPTPVDADIRFSLFPRRVELNQISLTSGRSQWSGSLIVNDLRRVEFATQFDARLNWAELGGWLGLPGWQGDVHWRARGSITDAATSLDGSLTMNTLRTGAANWEHIPWRLESRLAVLHERAGRGMPETELTLTSLRVQAVGGTLVGAAGARIAGGTVRARSSLDLRGAQFPQVASALRMLPVDLTRLPWTTAFHGPVEIDVVHPASSLAGEPASASAGPSSEPGLQIRVDLQARPPEQDTPAETPVSGALRATFVARERRLQDVDVRLDLPGTRLYAAGWMQSDASDMRLELETANLDSIKPAAELFWRGFSALPLHLAGKIDAKTHWTGGWREAVFRGPVSLTSVTYDQHAWEEFSGVVSLHRRVIESAPEVPGAPGTRHTSTDLGITSGMLRRGRSTSEFALTLGLRDGRFQPDSRFQASGTLRQFDVAILQSLLGSSLPIAGAVDARFDAAGTRRHPRGRASVSMAGGSVYGESFTSLSTELQFEPGPEITLNPVRLTRGGILSGHATVRPESREFNLELAAERFSVGELPGMNDRQLPVKGLLAGRITGGGTFDSPAFAGEFTLQDAGVGASPDGRLHGTLRAQNDALEWSASGTLFGGDISGSGRVGLKGPYPLTASLDFRNAALQGLGLFAQGMPEGLEGSLDVGGRIRGNGADASSIAADGEIARLEISRMGVAVRNQQPVAFRYQQQQFHLESLRLVGDQVDLRTSGTIRAASDPELNLRATGNIDLAALSGLDPQVATQGSAELDAQITGTIRRPQWRGRLSVNNASAEFGRLANSLSAIRGRIVFDGNRGDLEDFRAESGGGEILIGGSIRYGEGSGLQFNLNGRMRNVRIRYPEALSTWIDGQVNWSGSTRASLLEGRVTINRHSIAPPNDLAQVLFARRRADSPPLDSPFLRNLRLNLAVTSAPEVRLDTRTARNLQTAVDARIQGTGERPSILGRLGVLSGEIDFAGKRYTINRGEVAFLNPFRFEPELNLNVQARVQQFDITMDFSGPPDRLNVTYRSDPPLPTRDILALLVAGGSRTTSIQPSAQPLPQVTADSLLSQALSSQIGSRLDRIFGAGRLRVDPHLNTVSGRASATVALEQPIRNNITLLYATDVSSAQQQYVQGEWIISPRLSVVGIRDQSGLLGVNFQITLRFE